ncbi:hypothetical protein J2TS6_56980 [Paenibacillus albilobatus]|uniref:Uncharacterized protein n=1 Tax=Paenibacillus albilobatus TaxID=2716884 RepID=A0A920CFB9_9BACL|nr:hypothetical protein J2TS6_56980 [Paenibacillus albilobatus]
MYATMGFIGAIKHWSIHGKGEVHTYVENFIPRGSGSGNHMEFERYFSDQRGLGK